MLGEFYKGYYLSGGLAAPPGEQYYIRPDIGLSLGGIAFYRALNDKKFSYQAGLLQNEWQRKSAGSILVGALKYIMVPYMVTARWRQLQWIQKRACWILISFIILVSVPGLGYGYTLVYQRTLFSPAGIWYHQSGISGIRQKYQALLMTRKNDFLSGQIIFYMQVAGITEIYGASVCYGLIRNFS